LGTVEQRGFVSVWNFLFQQEFCPCDRFILVASWNRVLFCFSSGRPLSEACAKVSTHTDTSVSSSCICSRFLSYKFYLNLVLRYGNIMNHCSPLPPPTLHHFGFLVIGGRGQLLTYCHVRRA
jgi:hypothetical protein